MSKSAKRGEWKETDLYEPVRDMLAAQGFTVRGEVKGCDVAAVKDDALWVVEMKLRLNITLLYQAMERLRITDQVFVAVPRPRRANDKNYRAAERLLKKLELGLITVSLDSPVKTAEIILFPGGKPDKRSKAAETIRREIGGRTGDTAGGGVKTAINTAYRERCVRIACLLEGKGPLTAPELIRRYDCEKDAYAVMRDNHYGWFTNTGRGRFNLTQAGRSYLDENGNGAVVAYYRMKAADL